MISVYAVVMYGVFSALFCSIMGIVFRAIALRYHIVDRPTGGRKIHTRATPLLGGLSCMVTFFVFVAIAYVSYGSFDHFSFRQLLVIFISSLMIAIIGIMDDACSLRPMRQFFYTLCVIIITGFGAVNVRYITNPFGGLLDLQSIIWSIGSWIFFPIASLFAVVWLMMMSHVTKVLDGLDGLVSGTVAIGALTISIFSLFTKYYQPDIALLASILTGSSIGFLWWNHFPAKMFLGNAGSVWLGYMLGVLAIISGGKIAIAMLTLGVPLIDMIVVVIRRVVQKKSILKGDSTHLHFQLMHLIGHKKTVYLYWIVSACFGMLTIIAQGAQKITGFIVLCIFTGIVLWLVSWLNSGVIATRTSDKESRNIP